MPMIAARGTTRATWHIRGARYDDGMAMPMPWRTPTSRWWAAACTILIMAALLRLWNLDADEVRTDEGNYAVRAIGWNDFMFSTTLGSAWVWFQQAEELPWWTQLSFNDHPPLHFAAITAATRVFGVKLWAARLPSALYGVLTVATLIALVARWGHRGPALVAGAALALLPWHIFISRQAIQESGVIFWILLALLASWVAAEKTATGSRGHGWWAIAGVAVGLGVLTKYSAAVVLLPLGWLAWRQRWYRHSGFWVAPVVCGALLLPLFVYNWQLYLLRGHFDLQVSRVFRQDTKQDWPASHQAIWQGDARQVWQFTKNQARGMSLPLAVIFGVGVVSALRIRQRRVPAGAAACSFGAAAAVGVLSLLTLNDFGRSSILIPFYFLGVGIGLAYVPSWLRWGVIAPVSLAVLIGANVPRPALSAQLEPLVATFGSAPVGFSRWENWRARWLPTELEARHYISLLEWLRRQATAAGDHQRPLVVLDDRMSWFASNWYFFRYVWYARDVTFMNAGIFAFLNRQGMLTAARGRELTYVQVGPAALDRKGAMSRPLQATDEFLMGLAARELATPEIIRGEGGTVLLKIWTVQWRPEVEFPLTNETASSGGEFGAHRLAKIFEAW